MPTYRVIEKSTGLTVYAYGADAPLEWAGMLFATHDHIEVVPLADGSVTVTTGFRLTKLEFLRRFTQAERVAIRTAAQQSMVLADYMAMIDLAQDIDLTDVDTSGGVRMLEQAGLIAAGRADEILSNGN